jgi:hypothetical protein
VCFVVGARFCVCDTFYPDLFHILVMSFIYIHLFFLCLNSKLCSSQHHRISLPSIIFVFCMSWHVKQDRCSWGPNQCFNQILAEKNNFLVIPHICGRGACLNSYTSFPWNTFLSAVVQKVSLSGQFTNSESKESSLCREAGVTVHNENHLGKISAPYPPCILVRYTLV